MIKLHRYFTDGAVLQRSAPVHILGSADRETLCTLSGGGYRESRTAQAGEFFLTFPPVEDVLSNFTLSLACGAERLEVSLRFGDVYFAAGQSNMSYVLSAVEGEAEQLALAARADVSVLELSEPPFRDISELTRPPYPQRDFVRPYAWKRGEELLNCSALSVIAARALWEKKQVPIAFVQTAMGGLSIESYLKRETAERDETLLAFLKRVGRYQSLAEYNRAGSRNYTQLSGIFNEKIAPLLPFSFAGIAWYLGESSAWDFEYAEMFSRELGLLIGDLRESFGNIPFAAVHIAPEYYSYGDGKGYLYINEAITAAQSLGNVVAVPIYDIEPRWLKADGALYYHPIHPVNKVPVGERIADALLTQRRYPEIASVTFKPYGADCKIAYCGGGLREGELVGFTLAGENGKYYPAAAKTVAPDRVEVYSEDVPEPSRLTYAFMQYQEHCNARTKEGRPLLPYRTLREPAGKGYCFPPAFTVKGAAETTENCFGWQVGTCRKVPVWRKGEIYGASEVSISVQREGVTVSCVPEREKFLLFGISPALCLSGHKTCLDSFGYLNFTLSASAPTEFLGVAVRRADGEVFRLALLNGKERVSAIPLGSAPRKTAVRLTCGERGDGAPVRFSKRDRAAFVSAEFLFRAEEETVVSLSELAFSDKNRSRAGALSPEKEIRSDANLPDAK